ncbi:TPA: hypothetical protein L9W55_004967 [Klebsiella pneumoniae]|nr:hypothetical protein [Klebsiella pneumoniae]
MSGNIGANPHIKRFAHKTICFSKSEVMHSKIIGWYLTLQHYHILHTTTPTGK